MKKLLLSLLLVNSILTLSAQQWLGSTTSTNLIYRNGNVLVGGTSLVGTFGSNDRVIQIQIPSSNVGFLTFRNLTSSPSFDIGLSTPFGVAGLYVNGLPLTFSVNGERMRITTTGNVGIGTTNPGSFKLAVEGKIGAREVQVLATTPFPDYVFEKNYSLMNINALEDYIKLNKHLPNVPSASDIK
jgi:hypothetical protein